MLLRCDKTNLVTYTMRPPAAGSCGRICFSTAMKFILACAMVFTVIWCADNYNEAMAIVTTNQGIAFYTQAKIVKILASHILSHLHISFPWCGKLAEDVVEIPRFQHIC